MPSAISLIFVSMTLILLASRRSGPLATARFRHRFQSVLARVGCIEARRVMTLRDSGGFANHLVPEIRRVRRPAFSLGRRQLRAPRRGNLKWLATSFRPPGPV